MDVCALVDDLMDRSRLGGVEGLRFVNCVEDCLDSEVVVVDLASHADDIADIRRIVPTARLVAFGSHVDDRALDEALSAGADLALPRSRLLRDPSAVIFGDRT
ncbi:MAG: hypothetical protein M5U31_05350 [Acidimicrobiia bacterium]|nr:hypothetical protein [Acidimicrobiia bacterium]